MAYEKHNFTDGQTLHAQPLNEMDDAIIELMSGGSGGSSFEILTYSGTGTTSRTIALDKKPKMAIVFAEGKLPIQYDSSLNANKVYYSIAVDGGASRGASINDTGILLTNNRTPSSGVQLCMNESGVTYRIVAFY